MEVILAHGASGTAASMRQHVAACGESAGGRGGCDRPGGAGLFSYPLHRPGAPDREARTVHWRSLRCPVRALAPDAGA